ncbi:MAG TPA: hypothetical protein VEK79_17855 [Thermoanaerobaculia bacterium]|nr:hypothetical protein [Thermoanaerobaculia bacterium]
MTAAKIPRVRDVAVPNRFIDNGWRTPALFYADGSLPAATRAAVFGGRSRAVPGFASGPDTKFDVQVSGDSCVTSGRTC